MGQQVYVPCPPFLLPDDHVIKPFIRAWAQEACGSVISGLQKEYMNPLSSKHAVLSYLP
jgi:hypothetical protein